MSFLERAKSVLDRFMYLFLHQELNVTLDGVHMIQGLPLQENPFQFNVDDKPLYVGGSHHGRHGFVGCIRSLYVNGRIHDLKAIARGMEDYGVYPGKKPWKERKMTETEKRHSTFKILLC